MKYRSSIFSFDTLKFSVSLQGMLCLCLCLCLVMATELTARQLLHRGRLEPDKSLQKDIEENLLIIKNKNPLVWLIGNSTLEPLDTNDLKEMLSAPFIKITHGGATVNGSGAMLDYYLRLAVIKPKHVVVFMTKDDVNANGWFAETSTLYFEFMTWKKYVHWNYSRLRATRGSIYQKTMELWSTLFVRPEDQANWFKKYAFFRLPNVDQKCVTMGVMKDYQFDDRGFSLVADVCRNHGVQHISIVLLPISDSYAQWHDRLYPQLPYKTIRNKIAMLCARNDIHFIDLGKPLPAKYFSDFFHMNSTGSDYIMPLLASCFR